MKYLKEVPFEDAMRVFHGNVRLDPHTHYVWTSDFMGLATHSIPCQVCFNDKAILERNITPGQGQQSVQPCSSCQEQGYRVYKFPKWLQWVLSKC